MSIYDELIPLVEELKAKTKSKSIEWHEYSKSGRFSAEIDGTTVQIWQWDRPFQDENENWSNEDVISLVLFDGGGHEIVSSEVGEHETGYFRLQSLHEAALMQARNVEGVVKSLLARLKTRLRITKATYGALSEGKSAVVTEKVAEAVTGDTLSIIANNANFDDPAPGKKKALKVDYTFDGKMKSKTVEENETLTISASGD